jgi:hypothetical protein
MDIPDYRDIDVVRQEYLRNIDEEHDIITQREDSQANTIVVDDILKPIKIVSPLSKCTDNITTTRSMFGFPNSVSNKDLDEKKSVFAKTKS